jgi:hypothetical protein
MFVTMKKLMALRDFGWLRSQEAMLIIIGLAALICLLVYKLGSLVGGLSIGEVKTATDAVGLHGIYHAPLDLPVKLVRSVVFFLYPDHGQTLTRLPNVIFGFAGMISFSWLIWLWHGRRTAIFMTVLFCTSAWALHASRLASFDVLYLSAIPLLLLAQALLYRDSQNPFVWYGSVLVWGFLLYVPGLVWLILLHLYLQRKVLTESWRETTTHWRKVSTLTITALFLPLLIVNLIRPGQLLLWLGAPHDLAAPVTLGKQFLGVFVHLFVRGPQYSDIWLGRAPVLDAFVLLCAALGIYFYAKHWSAWRSKTLGIMTAAGVLLVALNGPVGLSLLVPLMYIAAAAGLAYLLHEWLKTFPSNPLARGLGIGIIATLVGLSCLYNLRAYYIAWPHNQVTKQTFQYHL